jgi:trimeric autotransporter adhesin
VIARRTLKILALVAALAIPGQAAESPHDSSEDLWQSQGSAPARRFRRIRRMKLDQRGLAAALAGAPRERSRDARERPLVLSLPDPDGGFQRFALHESPVMEPGLAAKHPEIKTYSGRGLDAPATTIRLDLTPLGLHASVRGPQGMWYVDPTEPRDPAVYRTYFGRDVVENPHGAMAETSAEISEISTDRGYYHAVDTVSLHGAGFTPLAPIAVTISASEGTFGSRTVDATADAQGAFDVSFVADPDENLGTHLLEASDGTNAASSGYDVVTAEDTSVDPPVGDVLRTYRLALLSDPTYAAYFGAENVTAAKVSLVNRVTHVYEAETAIRLVLIDGNDALNLNTEAQMTGPNGPCGGAACFTVAQATSCAGGTLARERQVIGLLAGASNFDIGHMALGLPAGGMSSLGVVGGNNKAMGCTGIATPVGDLFAVGLVAHEMGHQFSANHSFNGTQGACGPPTPTAPNPRNATTSVEPGSGSSIMGFAGLCGADDLQAHSDPYWSPRSFDEITNFVASAEANINDVQLGVLTGFDGMDSFQIRYNGKDSAPIQRGRNFTAAGIQAAIQGIAGWPAFGTASITLVGDTSFQITLGGSLAGTDVSPLTIVNCNTPAGLSGCTGFVGEVAKGGPTMHRGTVTPTGNSYPLVTAPAQFTIPLRTPFALTGSATDADGDPLTYTWEQNDRGGTTGTALLSNTKTNGPLFRQFETAAHVSESDVLEYASPGENVPGTEPTRVFPDLAQILANDTNAETGTCPAGDVECFSEFLPTSAYVGTVGVNANPPSLHFRLTARDGRPDGGGVNTASTTLVLATNAGPFLVTSPNAAEKYRGGSALSVTWDVANTNLAPVGTANVRISLSVDGGHSYPYELAASTPNDGEETVLLPDLATVHARVKVEAVGNVFFDVSNQDFVILALPKVMSSAPDGASVQYSDSLSPPLTVLASDPDSAGAALVASASGLPEGLSLVPSSVSDDAARPGSATWTVAGKTAGAPGAYGVTVTVTDEAEGTATTSFAIVVNAEDAEATYTGDVLAFTSPASPVADVLLRATVRDRGGEAGGADTEPGDIANATVSFVEDGAALCGPLPLALLDGKVSGTASCRVPLWPGAHSIDAVVGGFYSGTTTSVIEIDDPEGSAVTGAGSIVASRSAGVYAADAGSRVEFALGVKYKVRDKDERDERDDHDKDDKGRDHGDSRAPKTPKPPRGHIEVVFRSHAKSYVIRSNDLDLLGVSEETPAGKECHGRAPKCIGRSDTRWTASVIDASNRRKPITIATGLALQVTVTDQGDHPGTGDAIGITLWNGNTLVFSSAWTGAQTLEQALKTGKITVD